MSRDLSSTYVTSSAAVVYPQLAVYCDFSGSAVRVWTGNETRTFNDEFGSGSYLGVGTLGGISSVTETTEISAKGIELYLSGIPSEYVSLALSNPYRGRAVVVYRLLFNAAYTAYEQVVIFKGRMDQMQIEDGETTSTIKVKCESRLIDLNRPRDLRYTNEAQKELYPTDKGLEFVSGLAEKTIYWGSSAPSSTANSPSDSENPDGYEWLGRIT